MLWNGSLYTVTPISSPIGGTCVHRIDVQLCYARLLAAQLSALVQVSRTLS